MLTAANRGARVPHGRYLYTSSECVVRQFLLAGFSRSNPCLGAKSRYKPRSPLDPGRELNGRPSLPRAGRTAWSGVPCSRLPENFCCLSRRARGAWRRTRDTQGKGIPMPLYEHVYLARQDLSAQQVEEMTTTFKGVI